MNNEIESKIVEIFKNNLEDINMDYLTLLDAPLSSLNMNSITFIKIIVEIEVAFEIEIDPDNLDISAFTNIRSFASNVESKL